LGLSSGTGMSCLCRAGVHFAQAIFQIRGQEGRRGGGSNFLGESWLLGGGIQLLLATDLRTHPPFAKGLVLCC